LVEGVRAETSDDDAVSLDSASADNTVDEERELPFLQRIEQIVRQLFVQRAAQAVSRVYASRAVFVIAFVGGFFFTFGIGAALILGDESIPRLYLDEADDDVIRILRAKEESGTMAHNDWVFLGHSLLRRDGPRVRVEALDKYDMAVRQKHVDRLALDHTLAALGDSEARRKAVGILAAWPMASAQANPADDATARLVEKAASENPDVRHAALEALSQRRASIGILDAASATSAAMDAKSALSSP